MVKQNKPSTSSKNTIFSESKGSVFDRDGLLHRLMGDEDLTREIIDDFLEQIPDNLNAVKNALNKEDLPLLQREAHIIKGASGNIGALTMHDIAEKIENASKNSDLVKAKSLVKELDTQLKTLKDEMELKK